MCASIKWSTTPPSDYLYRLRHPIVVPLRARSWEALAEEEDEEQEATAVARWLCLPPAFSALEEGVVGGSESPLNLNPTPTL